MRCQAERSSLPLAFGEMRMNVSHESSNSRTLEEAAKRGATPRKTVWPRTVAICVVRGGCRGGCENGRSAGSGGEGCGWGGGKGRVVFFCFMPPGAHLAATWHLIGKKQIGFLHSLVSGVRLKIKVEKAEKEKYAAFSGPFGEAPVAVAVLVVRVYINVVAYAARSASGTAAVWLHTSTRMRSS
jgi:hypothetical protein